MTRRALFAALLLLGLAGGPGRAQQLPPDPQEETYDLPFAGDCGLVTRYASNRINPACLVEAENILLDEDLTIYRRPGQSAYNATGCQDLQAVRGLWPFDATDGTRYLIKFSSQSFFYSNDNGACTQLVTSSTFSATAPMSCAAGLGKLVCSNGVDAAFSISSTLSTHTITDMPRGEHVGFFRNRFLTAKVAGSFTRLYGSGEGDETDWTVQIPGRSTTPFTIDMAGTHDGKPVTCLMGEYQNAYFIGRDDELLALYGNDRRDFTLRKISDQVGCTEPKAVREKNNALYWMSRRGVERLTGTQITRVSDPIRPDIDEIITAAGNSIAATDTSQADFQAGNLTASGAGAPLSATIVPGGLVPSSSTFTDNSTTTFVLGALVNVSTRGSSVGLSVSTAQVYSGDFSDSSAWSATPSPPPGTFNGIANNNDVITTGSGCGNFTVLCPTGHASCSYIAGTNGCGGCTTSPIALGVWVFDGATGSSIAVTGIIAGLGDVDDAVIPIASALTSTSVRIAHCEGFGAGDCNPTGSGTGRVIQAATTPAGFNVIVDAKGATSSGYCVQTVADVRVSSYSSTGSLTSRSFDTTFSTPTTGNVSIALSSNAVGSITLQQQNSDDGSSWSTASSLPQGAQALGGKRYWRYILNYATSNGTTTATSSGLVQPLAASSTGYFISQCRNPGSSITSWGLFSCGVSERGGSITLSISTAASCHSATRSTATWNAITNNTAPTISTAAFVAYRALLNYSVYYDSAPTALNDCSFQWNEGSERPDVVAEVYKDRLYLFYTTSTASGAYNEHVAVLDAQDKWTIFNGITAASAAVYKNRLYTGDSQATGKVYLQDVGHDDAGASYRMRLRTADLDFGDPTARKSFKTLYVLLKSEEDITQDIDLAFRYRIDGSTRTYSLGSCGLDEAAEEGYFVCKMPFPTTEAVEARWLSLEVDYTGDQGPVRIYGMKIIYTRKERD